MNMSIKEILYNTKSELTQAIETIKELKSRLDEPIDGTGNLTETEQLCIDMEHSIERLDDIPERIIVAIKAGVYAGNVEGTEYVCHNDFGYDSVSHCKEYLELAEQYDIPYLKDNKIDSDSVNTDISNLIWDIYSTKGKHKFIREIKTPIGTLYIEKLLFRTEKDRIVIFDSDKKWMDYFTMESVIDTANVYNCSEQTIIDEYIRNMKNCKTIEDLLIYINLSWDEYSVDWEKIADILVERTGHQINSAGELLENEWVNKIGDYYILITEC